MINFEILKESNISKARIGMLKTDHGIIETPSFVPVATQAVVKTLNSELVLETLTNILISNTFHLYLKPGEKIISSSGGLHKFMNWKKPLMTDSGGFQVFSLGFGRDLGVGKVLKYFPEGNNNSLITSKSQPKSIRITDKGVHFKSPIDGAKLFIGPKESIKIQESLGADIIFAFDECTPPLSDTSYVKDALERTHKWAKICIKTKKSSQGLYGIVQGSKYKDLRIESAKYINSLGFDGYGIGGDLGTNKKEMINILKWVLSNLESSKPRHLLGIGYLEDIPKIIKSGIDTFDCIVPTHYARRGIIFTSRGKLDLRKSKFLKDRTLLDKKCNCMVCGSYKRNYIAHLFKANEMTAFQLATFHNLYFFNNYIRELRQKIKNNKL